MTTTIIHYANIEQFYRHRGGERSGERDFGVWHIDDCGLFSPRANWPLEPETIRIGDEAVTVLSADSGSRIRVSVVDQTGDVYGIQSGLGEGKVALIGNVGLTNPDYNRPGTDSLGPVYRRAEDILAGWADNEGLGRGISWFINRLREAATPDEGEPLVEAPARPCRVES